MMHPIVVGNKRRFFDDDTHVDALTLTGVERYDSGVLLLTYEPKLEG